MDWNSFDAALFDLDGVITPTAEVHMQAWSEMFNQFHAARNDPYAYTAEDYFAFVDGRPRYEGVATYLASRGIELPPGGSEDGPGWQTVCALGNRKNELFNTVLARDGITPYPGSVALLDALAARGVKVAVVSSSKNARRVLDTAGLLDRFRVVVDGVVAARLKLPGKPNPDTFWFAADQLGVERSRAVVIEDATSGVQAGKAGDFGLVIGVDRGAGEAELLAAGADVVVADLANLV